MPDGRLYSEPTKANFSPMDKVERLSQSRNMEFILVTFCVFRDDRSRLIRLLQPWNMPLIPITLRVSREVKSRLVRPLQS